MGFFKNRGQAMCYLLVVVAGCLSIAGTYLNLKVTAVNGLVAAIGLCLVVVSHFKEEA
ncbi:MAG: hypothetical protein AB8G86_02095 [Saprospiraceae bacterium]